MQPEETPAQPAAPQANPEPAPAASLRDAKLESAHAELPPMSVIGGDSTPATKPGEIAKPKTILAAGKRVLTEDEVNA